LGSGDSALEDESGFEPKTFLWPYCVQNSANDVNQVLFMTENISLIASVAGKYSEIDG